MKIIKQVLAILLLTLSMSLMPIVGHTEIIRNIRSNSRIIDVPMPSFLYKINIRTEIGGGYDLNISTTPQGSEYGLKFSTSVYAPAFYGDGQYLTGIASISDHILLASTGTKTHVQSETDLTNLFSSTSTLEGYIFNLWTSTIALRTDVTNLFSSTATLEGYIFNLWASTIALRTDVDALIISTGTFWVTQEWEQYFSYDGSNFAVALSTGLSTEFLETSSFTITGEYTLPTTDGLFDTYLRSNGAGTVTWATVSDTQNRRKYAVVIGSFAAPGTDLVTDGTNDEEQLEIADSMVSPGDRVLVLPGEYNFNTECDITTPNIFWEGYGATINVGAGLAGYKGVFKFSASADNCTIEGFIIEGDNVTCVGIAAFSGVYYLTIKNIYFRNIGNATTGHTINLDSGSHYAVVEGCSFYNCDGQYTIRADTAFCTFKDLTFQLCQIGLYIGTGGAASVYTNLNMSDIQGGVGIKIEGPRNVLTNLVLLGAFSGIPGGIEITGKFNIVANSEIYNVRAPDGILLTAISEGNVISNVTIGEVLTLSGITDQGTNNTIIACTFVDTIARYPIEIDGTASGTKIIGGDATAVDGSIANTVLDGGTGTTIIEFTPNTDSKFAQSAIFQQDLTVNGTFYVNEIHSTIIHTATATYAGDATGLVGTTNTAMTVSTRTIPAGTLATTGDRIRIRTWVYITGGAAITITTKLNGVVIADIEHTGAGQFDVTEAWCHYVDNTHMNIIEQENGSGLGDATAVNVAGVDWSSEQNITVEQTAAVAGYVTIHGIFVDVLPYRPE